MRSIVAIGLVLAAFPASVVADENPRIEVAAESRMSVRPNQATIHITVAAVAKNTEQALSDVKKRVATAGEILKKYKLSDRGVQKSEIEVNSIATRGGEKFVKQGFSAKEGYYASLRLAFTLLDMKQHEELSAKLAEVEGVELDKPIFGRSDAEDLKQQNLKKALANAQSKAKFMADVLGVKLGSPVFAREMASYNSHPFAQTVNMQLDDNSEDPFSLAQPPAQTSPHSADSLDRVNFVTEVMVHFSIEK